MTDKLVKTTIEFPNCKVTRFSGYISYCFEEFIELEIGDLIGIHGTADFECQVTAFADENVLDILLFSRTNSQRIYPQIEGIKKLKLKLESLDPARSGGYIELGVITK